MKKTIPHSIILLFCFSAVQSEIRNPKIDSLLSLLEKDKVDTTKVSHLNALSQELWQTGEYEKAMQYANEALQFFQGSITLEKSFLKGKASAYNNIGIALWNQGNYPKALEYYFQALKINEELADKNKIAGNLGNIGLVYFSQADYPKATEYYFKSLKIAEELGDKNRTAIQLGNIGNVYYQQGNKPKALEYYLKSLKAKEEIGNKNSIANTLSNIGIVYEEQNDESKALEYYFKSLRIQEEIGDKSGVAATLGNIGSLYAQQKIYNEAERYLLKAIRLTKETGALDYTRQLEKLISNLYFEKGEYQKAYEHLQLYSIAKDSLFSEESSRQIAKMSTKYETEKKEKEIELLQKDKEIQQTEIARQKLVRNAVAGGLFLVAAFAFVLFNRFRLIRRQKRIIEKEREKSEKLLLNILPKDTAEELKATGKAKPQHYDRVTVMFTDFKGFTTIAEKMSAEELVSELDFIFKRFDEIISKYPIEKIKTIGDAYMCAGGLPVANITNPVDVVLAALEIQEFMEELAVGNRQLANEKPKLPVADWKLRIGIHTGPVIAGVVGDKKFAYDIWGDTVNTASRMESSGEPGKVNISGDTYKHLVGAIHELSVETQDVASLQERANHDLPLRFIFRGKIAVKNKGEVEMYFVEQKTN